MLAFVVDADCDHRARVGVSLAALGYEVFPFEEGEEAIAAARSVIPSLVLTDVFAPSRDGIEVLDAIRRLHRRCRLVAMLRTREPLSGAFRTTLEHLGADATLLKPVDHQALRAVVERLRDLPHDPDSRGATKPAFPAA